MISPGHGTAVNSSPQGWQGSGQRHPPVQYLTERCCYFVTRLRKKVSYEVLRVIAEGRYYRDRLVWFGKCRADRAAHPVRLVELLVRARWYRYLTNVREPSMLPATQIWALYVQRWAIEQAFAAVKRALGSAYLGSSHINGVLIQVWATLAVYRVLQDLRLEIATANGWREDDVSWEMPMRLDNLRPPASASDNVASVLSIYCAYTLSQPPHIGLAGDLARNLASPPGSS